MFQFPHNDKLTLVQVPLQNEDGEVGHCVYEKFGTIISGVGGLGENADIAVRWTRDQIRKFVDLYGKYWAKHGAAIANVVKLIDTEPVEQSKTYIQSTEGIPVNAKKGGLINPVLRAIFAV